MTTTYEFKASLWRWDVHQGVWLFVTLPNKITDEIDEEYSGLRAGFGSVKVSVSIGETTWETSVFPSKEEGGFILPIKKAVRKSEGLDEGSTASVRLTPID
ncbi:DUF1905 domain-containing protein [Demequina aurantiaca]|uniref:DUF1905 domain-containing protein n=1 Tax=Demequina aurantiaca TaxID=676200 RepID=UPI000780F16E|nr:DUF1905 domain-containing protein [Demequina aurantiaca]